MSSRGWLGLVAAAALLVLVLAASLAWGARDVPLGTVADALTSPQPGNNDHAVVLHLRLPRTIVGLLGGVALGLVGALLQGLTRNPLADPGLVGVNAGASLAVIVAITSFGVATAAGYVWFAFAGAAAAAGLVYGAASLGREGATPVRLALVGAAFTAVATSLVTLVLLLDEHTLQEYRFWSVGSLVGRDLGTTAVVAPFLAAGGVLAFASARVLNVLALGEDVARGLGQRVPLGRGSVLLATVLLAGCAVSLVGPVAFVGLAVPHVARGRGPGLPLGAAVRRAPGRVLLLAADMVGRLVLRPSELEAGLVVAFAGAPVLLWLVRRSKAVPV